jgi:hypothetical protein
VLAADEIGSALATLPGEIQQVGSAGRWRTSEAQGFYRVIVLRGGYERVIQRLYVQWMRDADSENPPRVVATTGVTEINDAGPYTFTHALRAVATNRLRVTVDARHGYTGRRQRFVVEAAAPGVYSVRAGQSALIERRTAGTTSRASRSTSSASRASGHSGTNVMWRTPASMKRATTAAQSSDVPIAQYRSTIDSNGCA